MHNVDLSDYLNIGDFEKAAREKLSPELFSTLFGGVGQDLWETNTHNVQAFRGLSFRPRVMSGVGIPKLATSVLGQEIALPVLAAPTGSHQRVTAEGEISTAQGAAAAGTAMIMSSVSNFSLEEVGPATPGPKWFQSYVFKDREMSADLIRRAENSGFTAVVITVDNISGRVEHNERARRSGYSFADEVRTSQTLQPERVLRNLQKYETAQEAGDKRIQRQGLGNAFDGALSWDDLVWVRTITDLPIVVKGIQTAEDAILAVRHGANAIVVSNHGGTSAEIDGQPGSLTLLPEVSAAVAGQIEIYLDGGIRNGGDVLKALALGARAVLVGRAEVWGLAVAGAAGLARVFEVLGMELRAAMGLCGVADVEDVSRFVVADVPGTTHMHLVERFTQLRARGEMSDDELSRTLTWLQSLR